MHHAAYRRRVFALDDLLHSAEAQAANGLAHVARAADEAATHLMRFAAGFAESLLPFRPPNFSSITRARVELGPLCAARAQLFHCFRPLFGHLGLVLQPQQRIEGGLDHVVRIRGADATSSARCESRNLHHRAHRTSGDDSGSFGRGLQQHLPRPVVARSPDAGSKCPSNSGESNSSWPARWPCEWPWALREPCPCRIRHGPADRPTTTRAEKAQVLAALDDLGDALDGNHLVL